MKENDLNTVDVRDGDKRVILKRGAPVDSNLLANFSPIGFPIHHGRGTTGPTGDTASSSAPIPSDDAGLHPINSPMVGTFYTSSGPDAKAFVSVGSTVDEETDVCIIEAMKVFNNIKAETRGTIAKILVENGATVEFGQTLFLVKPA
jgi:acetyl-CoA carboxylase biotin carboxyl carrier protein